MTVLRIILGDQCRRDVAALRDLDPARDRVLSMEVAEEADQVRHHRQKISFLFSVMRHFNAALRARGVQAEHVALDDPDNTGSFTGEVLRAVRRHRPERIVVTFPGEWRVLEMIRGWEEAAGIPVEIREDDRFLCTRAEFARWAKGRQQLRMEFFYREMRRRHAILMEPDGTPTGGAWNFDPENRRSLPRGLEPPAPSSFPPDATTKAVLDLVARKFPDRFGGLESFNWPVTAKDAARALESFLEQKLPQFGDYQDAMAVGQPVLFHSLLSVPLNAGLLDPLEICQAAEAEYRAGRAPLNAVEGFIRQILGWREYVRGVYWLRMPHYATTNALEAERPLPDFYWTADTPMRCVSETVAQTRDHAHAHHIQRLMVTGNFALLAGIAPEAINEWYLAVYADAYEWVQLPNTHGMAVFADGGMLGSKPYAASGAYINRMSDYCRHCAYDVKAQTGDDACPFNFLYWDFIARHAKRLSGNARMSLPLRNMEKMDATKLQQMRRQAKHYLDEITPTPKNAYK
ncbi:cryptochrome/photolyase family protein [Pseudoroseomonas deserti]|uniref:Cryptochrome/photolyase family protein n=1 Tax=Teichococcus deserti TaxID=1817963 RepID=A0A1V2H4A4_9PROT|nr:cryptochrome/photolyase family protein [Pseudoroseomonas deserti]ONG55502.1 cryptochrome/photolyase family protein [Pseudoroseomonas deserti]